MKPILVPLLVCVLSPFAICIEEQSSLDATSKTGLKGYTLAVSRHSQGEWMNNILIVTSQNNEKKKFQTSRAFIEKWAFSDNDTTVILKSMNAHGPAWIEKFNISTGDLIAECSGSKDLKDTPAWAWPLCN